MVEGNFTVTLSDDVLEDTDGDGFSDAMEVSVGSDLNDPNSTPLGQGLVGWYPFDGNASDMSGNGNHATVYGATLSVDRHLQANMAYSFDGVNDSIGGGTWFNNLNEGAFSIWIKNEAPVPTGNILIMGSVEQFFQGGNFNHAVYQNRSGGPGTRYHYPNPVDSFSNLDWVQITVTWNAQNTMGMWLNGRPYDIGVRVTDGGVSGNYPNFGVGARQDLVHGSHFQGFFHGSIDDIRIYNRVLSTKEIDFLYRKESPNHFAELNSTVNLEMIWVEPGTFTMGSPTSEAGRRHEIEHNVTLTKGFYLGKYEVTQAQYEAVMAGNHHGLESNTKSIS